MPNGPKLDLYFKALAEWETIFLHYAICIDLGKKSVSGHDPKDDSSPEASLVRQINNRIKHHAEDISEGHNSVAAKVRHLTGNDTISFWLTNDGLKTKEYELGFKALAEELDSAAKFADDIHNIQKMIEEKKKRDGTA